jgi:hypothetical protein
VNAELKWIVPGGDDQYTAQGLALLPNPPWAQHKIDWKGFSFDPMGQLATTEFDFPAHCRQLGMGLQRSFAQVVSQGLNYLVFV